MEEINELKREGLSIQAISELTGYDRKTIRKYLLKPDGRPVYGPRPAPVSKLEPFKPYLKERLQAGVWNAQVLLRELRERNYTRRLHDPDGLAAAATRVGARGCGAAVRDAARQTGAGGLGPSRLAYRKRRRAHAVGLHDHAGLQPA